MKVSAKTAGRVITGAAITMGGFIAAALLLSVTGLLHSAPALVVAVAIAVAFIGTSALNYVLTVNAVRQEVEDELLDEIAEESDQPRRFNDVNFR